MKYTFLVLAITFISCNQEISITQEKQKEFQDMAQSWHSKYVQGSENLEEILLGLDKNIKMWENGRAWTYEEVEKFGPHLPEKHVLETYNDQYLLNNNLSYDYVSQKYISSITRDTIRETSSRLWKMENGKWELENCPNE